MTHFAMILVFYFILFVPIIIEILNMKTNIAFIDGYIMLIYKELLIRICLCNPPLITGKQQFYGTGIESSQR